MKYHCVIKEFNFTYDFNSSEDEEDRIDFLLSAETAFEEFDNSGKNKRNQLQLQIESTCESGTKKTFVVTKKMKPSYYAHDIEEEKE